jgi:predicted RNA-binding protein (virulence factor B family)
MYHTNKNSLAKHKEQMAAKAANDLKNKGIKNTVYDIIRYGSVAVLVLIVILLLSPTYMPNLWK